MNNHFLRTKIHLPETRTAQRTELETQLRHRSTSPACMDYGLPTHPHPQATPLPPPCTDRLSPPPCLTEGPPSPSPCMNELLPSPSLHGWTTQSLQGWITLLPPPCMDGLSPPLSPAWSILGQGHFRTLKKFVTLVSLPLIYKLRKKTAYIGRHRCPLCQEKGIKTFHFGVFILTILHVLNVCFQIAYYYRTVVHSSKIFRIFFLSVQSKMHQSQI